MAKQPRNQSAGASQADSPEPWYAEGLPFGCTQCGKCCHSRGEYDHVYVNARERRAIAHHLGISPSVFTRRYTVDDGQGYRSLRFDEEACVFLEGNLCSIHEVKPTQCRTWPFWSELLESRKVYEAEVQAYCPGSNDGQKVPAAEIERQARITDEALEEDD